MKELGIAILVAACLAIIVPVVFHIANPQVPPTQRVGNIDLTPTATPAASGFIDGTTVAQAAEPAAPVIGAPAVVSNAAAQPALVYAMPGVLVARTNDSPATVV